MKNRKVIFNLDLILSLQFENECATDKLFVTELSTLDLIWHVLCQIFLCNDKIEFKAAKVLWNVHYRINCTWPPNKIYNILLRRAIQV